MAGSAGPTSTVEPGETAVLADIAGPGAIQSMWFGGTIMDRDFILRIYWEDQQQPSVECPLTDFFAMPYSFQNPQNAQRGSGHPDQLTPVAVNPTASLNCFWEMPFRRQAQNYHRKSQSRAHRRLFLPDQLLPDRRARSRQPTSTPSSGGAILCPTWRNTRFSTASQGRGHYVGTSMGWSINNNGWWGEGEIKFFIDGDGEYPDHLRNRHRGLLWRRPTTSTATAIYRDYTTPFMGMHQVLQTRRRLPVTASPCDVSLAHHGPDQLPQDLRVTIQALGLAQGRTLLSRASMISVPWRTGIRRCPRALSRASGSRLSRNRVDMVRLGGRIMTNSFNGLGLNLGKPFPRIER